MIITIILLPLGNCLLISMFVIVLKRKNCKNDTRKIDSLIMKTRGSICVYEYGSSVKSANDRFFESHENCKNDTRKIDSLTMMTLE